LVELYIKDSTKGVVHEQFKDIPDGSIMATYKVHDVDLWNKIEKGEVRGFSIEAWLNYQEAFNKEDKTKEEENMNIKELFKKLLTKLGKFVAIDGTEIYYDGEEIEVGMEVFDAEGNPVVDGEYEADDKIVVVADGKVSEIREKEVEEPEAEEVVEEEIEIEAAEEPETVEEVVEVVEEEPAPEDKAEVVDEIADIKREIEEMKKQIEQILSFLQEPVVEPIVEEFEKAVEPASGKYSKAVNIFKALKN